MVRRLVEARGRRDRWRVVGRHSIGGLRRDGLDNRRDLLAHDDGGKPRSGSDL